MLQNIDAFFFFLPSRVLFKNVGLKIEAYTTLVYFSCMSLKFDASV
jgi:hypothetical protein